MTREDIFKAKEERRKKLAALPIMEKLKLIEFLHDEGIKMRKWREEFQKQKKAN